MSPPPTRCAACQRCSPRILPLLPSKPQNTQRHITELLLSDASSNIIQRSHARYRQCHRLRGQHNHHLLQQRAYLRQNKRPSFEHVRPSFSLHHIAPHLKVPQVCYSSHARGMGIFDMGIDFRRRGRMGCVAEPAPQPRLQIYRRHRRVVVACLRCS